MAPVVFVIVPPDVVLTLTLNMLPDAPPASVPPGKCDSNRSRPWR